MLYYCRGYFLLVTSLFTFAHTVMKWARRCINARLIKVEKNVFALYLVHMICLIMSPLDLSLIKTWLEPNEVAVERIKR